MVSQYVCTRQCDIMCQQSAALGHVILNVTCLSPGCHVNLEGSRLLQSLEAVGISYLADNGDFSFLSHR